MSRDFERIHRVLRVLIGSIQDSWGILGGFLGDSWGIFYDLRSRAPPNAWYISPRGHCDNAR